MCLAIPGKVIELYREHGVLMGMIDFDGIRKGACLEHVADVGIGEYVLVHVGFALSKIDPAEAALIFDFLKFNSGTEELRDGEVTG